MMKWDGRGWRPEPPGGGQDGAMGAPEDWDEPPAGHGPTLALVVAVSLMLGFPLGLLA